MKSLILTFIIIIHSYCFSQNFWQKTNFPTDGSSAYSVYSMTTNSSNHLLAGTFTKGVLKSTDDGITWSESGLSSHWIVSFAKDNSGNIFCASIGSQFGSGVYKSIDQGGTWNKVWDALTGMNYCYVDKNNNVYVCLNYISQQGGIYYSSNSGSDWSQIFNLTENVYSIIKLNTGRLLAAGYGKVFYSDDNGANWNVTTSGLVSFTPSNFIINSQNEVFLATLGYGIYKSTDNGITWQNKTGAGPDYSCLIINSDGWMYAGTRGYWVYRSTDNGESWQLINSGMGEDKYVLSLLTNSSGYLFAGLDYNGLYKSVNPVVTSIVGELNQKIEYELTQNYPNPFNPSTKIRYSIPSNVKGKTSNVILKVYDVLGNKVATLVDEYKTAGSYEVDFDAAGLSSGVYFYKFTSGSYSLTKKMVLMR